MVEVVHRDGGMKDLTPLGRGEVQDK